ncbi:fatty acid elongation [Aureococcus anophagefferens]|uniref:Fatty acid elongation n=1 Tax=Aureococcus anophagefferens TaxID=44056 RepID=A0ABR1G144_AURAN
MRTLLLAACAASAVAWTAPLEWTAPLRRALGGCLAGACLVAPTLARAERPLPVVEEVVNALSSRGLDVGGFDEIRAADAVARALDGYGGVVRFETSQLARALGEAAPLGVALVKDSAVRGALTVTAVEPASNAFAAGVRVGDAVVAVDGRKVDDGASAAAAAKTLRSARAWTVERPGAKRFAVDVRGATPAPAPLAAAAAYDGVVYVKISSFGDGVAGDVARAVAGVAATADAYVVDVRANPGGFLDAAVDVASLFLPPGTPIATLTDAPPFVTRTPDAAIPAARRVAVLVDGETRSAAEIFAAAIQSSNRGAVVGERTFGKGTAQSLLPLRSAPGAALRLTTARVAVQGRALDGAGVAPDVVAENSSDGLDALLVAKGAYFDFASEFARSHPGLADDRVEAALAADLRPAWRAFLARGVDVDVGLGDYPPEVRGAAAAARARRAARAVRSSRGRRRVPPQRGRRGPREARARGAPRRRRRRPRRGARAVRWRRAPFGQRARAPPRAPPPPPVLGFDGDADCLPLQTCDRRQYVYLVVP